mmetsp:Transcript_44432/g.117454  ORF Transcript_44432/g.117454 Transcript_44432/m.117454 type:complete len:215 (+) Transcript_44432:1270-1914(+)
MTPKMGIIWNCVAQCVTMCSASSSLPRPVMLSITTMPPSAKGLPAGALTLGAVVVMVCSFWCNDLLKEPPSISMTLTMPAQRLMLHSITTPAFVICALEKALGADSSVWAPAMRSVLLDRPDQGNRIFRSGVSPIDSPVSSFMKGWKIGIGCILPLTLIAGSAWNLTSLVERSLVSASQRMPSGGALLISRADRLTQSPRTVYSMRFALPQTPQ